MQTRSGLFGLFALLVAVPVAAAVYLGTAGLQRERDMLVEQERRAMERRADDVRDRLVLQLQQLYRTQLARDPAAYLVTGNDRRQPVHDSFVIVDGEARAAWGKVPPDIEDLARTRNYTAVPQGLSIQGDLVTRAGTRAVLGFRIDASRLTERYLDPVSPHSVVPRIDERLEYARLVSEQNRLGASPTDEYGLRRVHYRHVVPSDRQAAPVLMPRGYVLELGIHPAASLGRQLTATEERLWWTLGIVALVVVLGLAFAWRAVRAEARLATRKAEFVSAVSHELRTPLTSIRMYADMLKEGWVKDDTTRADYFALISAESERLTRLVNNVLDFSSIEKGKKDFEMRLGDPGDVVRDVAEVLRPYLREKGFELHVESPETLPECSFDKDALTQILVNLIDNAVKYGEREVRLEADVDNGNVYLRVLDRGQGIPAGERERIFEAFQRGSNAHSGGGSGLGLALVRHYAHAHRGEIEIDAREGGGSIFSLRLPAA